MPFTIGIETCPESTDPRGRDSGGSGAMAYLMSPTIAEALLCVGSLGCVLLEEPADRLHDRKWLVRSTSSF